VRAFLSRLQNFRTDYKYFASAERLGRLAGLSLLLSVGTVNADIIGVTGQATVVAPPPTVAPLLTGSTGIVFGETTVVLPSNVVVDISAPGSYTSLASLTSGTIAAGTAVSSYYYHSLGPDTTGDVFFGSITFSTPILGVEALAAEMIATNGLLGSPTTTYYSTDQGQSFEFGIQIDSVVISADRLTISFLNETFTGPDDLRIITATPEPSSMLLMSTALLALAVAARLRRSSKEGEEYPVSR